MPRSTSRPTTVLGLNDSYATVPVRPSPSNGSEATGYGATGGERIVYRLPYPAPGSGTALLIHPPRIHRHRYHGVPAPNAKLRHQVIALGREKSTAEESSSGQLDAQSAAGSSDGAAPGRRTSSTWAALIARIYDVLPLVCPGTARSVVAADP